MIDLIEKILDIFDGLMHTEKHYSSMILTDIETIKGDFRKELENLFIEQDKISPNRD